VRVFLGKEGGKNPAVIMVDILGAIIQHLVPHRQQDTQDCASLHIYFKKKTDGIFGPTCTTRILNVILNIM